MDRGREREACNRQYAGIRGLIVFKTERKYRLIISFSVTSIYVYDNYPIILINKYSFHKVLIHSSLHFQMSLIRPVNPNGVSIERRNGETV